MKIAFLHYHLKTGGVTTVIRQQIEALKSSCELLLITGEPTRESFSAKILSIPGIAYDNPAQTQPDPLQTANAIKKAIYRCWPTGCDLLHVHNPTMAKNKNLLKILKYLQISGIKLFLQIHDFAEDGRPALYYKENYPANCHYGVINSRDYQILLKSGLSSKGLHLLSNTVTPIKQAPILDGDLDKHLDNERGKFILYPIRALRRKNIGEAILLSLFFPKQTSLIITLPPNSPLDIKSYQSWQAYVAAKKLNVKFGSELKNNFSQLVQSAESLITTSISEGFGFSFLEPWTASKLVWGRILADICNDFQENGMRFDHFYNTLDVPLQALNIKIFLEKMQNCILLNSAKFNFNISTDSIKAAFKKITQNNRVDFGLLNELMQQQVIDWILASDKNFSKMLKLNPHLYSPNIITDPQALIKHNAHVVKTCYNQSVYRENLLAAYNIIIQNDVCQKIEKEILFKHFFNLEQFSLLKWSDDLG